MTPSNSWLKGPFILLDTRHARVRAHHPALPIRDGAEPPSREDLK